MDKILVVEDEISLRETLAYNFSHEGYEVQASGDGLEGLGIARSWHPDLILLDVMLPGMDGFEICKALRSETDIPILLLTARADEIDRVVGLEIGADDYIIKPFSMRELGARVKLRLKTYHQLQAGRVVESPGEMEIMKFNDLMVDKGRHEVSLHGNPLPLKPREYELLIYLMENQGRVVTREMVLEQVWGWDYIGGSRTVDVHIRWLRSKIEADPGKPVRIITVPGVGYRFEG